MLEDGKRLARGNVRAWVRLEEVRKEPSQQNSGSRSQTPGIELINRGSGRAQGNTEHDRILVFMVV